MIWCKSRVERVEGRFSRNSSLFGQKASRQAGLIMEELGISLKDHRTRPIDDKLLDQADLILP